MLRKKKNYFVKIVPLKAYCDQTLLLMFIDGYIAIQNSRVISRPLAVIGVHQRPPRTLQGQSYFWLTDIVLQNVFH